jgi:hypothetical protein
MQTKAPDTTLGIKAKALQEALFANYADIFSVTVTIGNTSGQLPFQNLVRQDVHLLKNFQGSMKEAKTCQITFVVPDIDANEEEKKAIEKELAASFFDFITRGADALTGDNAVFLLLFALESGLETLGKSCVDYIFTHGSFDEVKTVQLLVELIEQHEDLQSISRTCAGSLTSIKLDKCYGISTFANCDFPNVQEVELKSTNLTNQGAQALSQACKNLKTLTLDKNRVTPEEASHFFPNIQISKPPKIT